MVRVLLTGGPLDGFETEIPDPEKELRPVLLDRYDEPHQIHGFYKRRPDDHEFQPWVYFWRKP